MIQKIVKGLLMALALIFTDYQNGEIVWAASILAASCVLVGYYAKNWWFPSVSEDGVMDWRDIASALIVAAVAAVSDSISSLVVDGQIIWLDLAKTVGAVVWTYIVGTYFSKAKN
jgi:hypothetical protein